MNKKKFFALLIVLVMLLSQSGIAFAADDYQFQSTDQGGTVVPVGYEFERIIFPNLGQEFGSLKNPQDMFVGKDGNLYIADSDNNRIVKMTKEGKPLAQFKGPFNIPDPVTPIRPDFASAIDQVSRIQAEEQYRKNLMRFNDAKKMHVQRCLGLKNPKGIYVHDNGDMYIADSGNQRVIILTADGNYKSQLVKPNSVLLEDEQGFDVSKVFVSYTGIIYVIRGKQFITMDINNEFKGFVGQPPVGFDFWEAFWRLVGSREQVEKLKKREPVEYTNFFIGEDGSIYATTLSGKLNTQQIRKLNTIGTNVLAKKSYGGTFVSVSRESGEVEYTGPEFNDVAVDKYGIITVADNLTGMIFQYDQEGNNLIGFGKKGEGAPRESYFGYITSLNLDKDGNLYVLDSIYKTIQVFNVTDFMKNVHAAVKKYSEGLYQEAVTEWQKILDLDGTYALAHRGLAKAYMKSRQWQKAMDEYRLAEDKKGYSDAFFELRNEWMRDNFWVAAVGGAAVVLIYFMLAILTKKSRRELKKMLGIKD